MDFVHILWKAFTALVLLIAVIVVIGAIDTSLYEHSMELIKEYSTHWNSSSFATFAKDYVLIATMLIAIIGSAYVLMSGPKIGQLLWLNGVAVGLTLNCTLNNIHRKLRPSWNDLTIPILGGNKTYGSPSECSTFSGCVLFGALFIYLLPNNDFFLSDAEKTSVDKSRRSIFYKVITKLVITAVSLSAYALLLYCEVYTGIVSIDQMLYGLFLSMVCVISFFFFFRELLVSFYKTALTGQQSLRMPMIILGIISIVVLVVEIVIYFVQKASNLDLDAKTVAHIQSKIPDFTSETPLSTGLIDAGLGFVAIGAHLGVLLQPKLTKIDPIRASLNVSILGKIGRLIFIIFMVAPLPFVMIVYFPENPGILYVWFKGIIPSLLVGFIFFVLGDFLMARIGLLPKIHDKPKETEKKVGEGEKLENILAKVEVKGLEVVVPIEVLLETRETTTTRNNVPST